MALSTKERKDLLTRFGNLVYNKRKELGMSQEELSRKAGYKMNMANLWEKGTRAKLNEDEFENIARCLKLSDTDVAPYKLLISGKDRAEYTATKDNIIQTQLKILFDRQGISQAEFARSLEIGPSHVSAWLAGRAEPKIGHLKQIVALYFPVTLQAEAIEFLLYGTPYPARSYKQQAELWKQKYEECMALTAKK